MYAYINSTSDNGKEIIFGVSYNDVMFELESIEIDGCFYDMDKQPEYRVHSLYLYMISRINVWPAIRKYRKEIEDEMFIDENY